MFSPGASVLDSRLSTLDSQLSTLLSPAARLSTFDSQLSTLASPAARLSTYDSQLSTLGVRRLGPRSDPGSDPRSHSESGSCPCSDPGSCSAPGSGPCSDPDSRSDPRPPQRFCSLRICFQSLESSCCSDLAASEPASGASKPSPAAILQPLNMLPEPRSLRTCFWSLET